MTTEFLHRDLKPVKKRVFRLGLAANYGIDEAGIRAAFDRGVNYVYDTWRGDMKNPLKDALAKQRDGITVASTASTAYLGGSVRRGAERALKRLGTDYLDVYLLGWLGVGAAWTDATVRELEHLKSSGKVRAIGVSIHDRERAGRLAADSPLDLLMIRYNMAHPGAERDIFPHLSSRKDGREPAIVAYTATRWRKLLKRPSGWDGPVPTAGDCYRWCLSNSNVDLVLTGPATAQQLDENLKDLEKGPVTADEDKWMRELGKVVHG